MLELRSPLQAHIVHLLAQPGQAVRAGQVLLVLEAMKMEHEVLAPHSGVVKECFYAVGESVAQDEVVLVMERSSETSVPQRDADIHRAGDSAAGPGAVRADLARVQARHAFTLDAQRPEAVAKRHALGLRTARENLADLCDPGSFSEYGALAVAAQSQRRSLDDLVRNTPADGMVCGTATIHGAACVVMAY
ncbi:MAG: biotin/lipoyl-containing protein, partial [Rhodoferax sp.]